jgi:hypothetical protein
VRVNSNLQVAISQKDSPTRFCLARAYLFATARVAAKLWLALPLPS